MKIINDIYKTYNELLLNRVYLCNISNFENIYIDEFIMFLAIYKHYNFKNNGCPYYDLNEIAKNIPQELFNDFVPFKPSYSYFLQDVYDILFLRIFGHIVKSTKIKVVQLNIKININKIRFEIDSNKTIQELMDLIAEYYNFRSTNLIIKKNNIELDKKKYIIESNLNEKSNLILYFNQIG